MYDTTKIIDLFQTYEKKISLDEIFTYFSNNIKFSNVYDMDGPKFVNYSQNMSDGSEVKAILEHVIQKLDNELFKKIYIQLKDIYYIDNSNRTDVYQVKDNRKISKRWEKLRDDMIKRKDNIDYSNHIEQINHIHTKKKNKSTNANILKIIGTEGMISLDNIYYKQFIAGNYALYAKTKSTIKYAWLENVANHPEALEKFVKNYKRIIQNALCYLEVSNLDIVDEYRFLLSLDKDFHIRDYYYLNNINLFDHNMLLGQTYFLEEYSYGDITDCIKYDTYRFNISNEQYYGFNTTAEYIANIWKVIDNQCQKNALTNEYNINHEKYINTYPRSQFHNISTEIAKQLANSIIDKATENEMISQLKVENEYKELSLKILKIIHSIDIVSIIENEIDNNTCIQAVPFQHMLKYLVDDKTSLKYANLFLFILHYI